MSNELRIECYPYEDILGKKLKIVIEDRRRFEGDKEAGLLGLDIAYWFLVNGGWQREHDKSVFIPIELLPQLKELIEQMLESEKSKIFEAGASAIIPEVLEEGVKRMAIKYPRCVNTELLMKGRATEEGIRGVLPKGWFLGTEPCGKWTDRPAIKKRTFLCFSKSMIAIGKFEPILPVYRGEPYIDVLLVYHPEALFVAEALKRQIEAFSHYEIQLGY